MSPKSKSRDKKKDLQQQRWYHGICAREDVEQLMTKPGDFLVRASENLGAVKIILSLNAGNRMMHLTIAVEDGSFYLQALGSNALRYPTVYDLIAHYKRHGLKLKSADKAARQEYLRNPVPRPKWMLKIGAINYDPKAKPLGSGHFAKVFVGTFRTGEGKDKCDVPVAIKVLKEKKGANDEKAKREKQAMIREGRIMSYYNHANVVQFFGLCCDTPQTVIIVLEYCPGGSLLNHLVAQKSNISVSERLTYCLEAALGMRYLHRQKCIHRDLASRNCLISSKGIVKIADFGLSTADNVTEQAAAAVFPIRWMAPETVVKDTQFFSMKSDIWSYGVLIYEIFSNGEKPWPSEDKKKIAALIQEAKMPELPAITPKGVTALVSAIWIKEANLRPSFPMIVKHLRDLRTGKLAQPKASEFTVNRIKGVTRGAEPTDTTVTAADDESSDSPISTSGSDAACISAGNSTSDKKRI